MAFTSAHYVLYNGIEPVASYDKSEMRKCVAYGRDYATRHNVKLTMVLETKTVQHITDILPQT